MQSKRGSPSTVQTTYSIDTVEGPAYIKAQTGEISIYRRAISGISKGTESTELSIVGIKSQAITGVKESFYQQRRLGNLEALCLGT